MSIIENLFRQIFESKQRIFDQVKHHIELYDRQLTSELLIDGVQPPLWLLNAAFHCQNSDFKYLRKQELISGRLLTHPQPAVSYSHLNCSLYNNPTVPAGTNELSDAFLAEKCTTNNDSEEMIRSSVNPVDGVKHVCKDVPRQEISANSPPDQAAASTSEVCPMSHNSIEKIQRSRSRQRAPEFRNSANNGSKITSQEAEEREAGISQGHEKTDMHSGRITRARNSVPYMEKLLHLDSSYDTDKEQSKGKSVHSSSGPVECFDLETNEEAASSIKRRFESSLKLQGEKHWGSMSRTQPALTYDDCSPFSSVQFAPDISIPCTSPAGKIWEGFTFRFVPGSSGRKRNSNPELTCYSIEEEDNVNIEEAVDKIQEKKCFTAHAIQDNCSDIPTLASVETFSSREGVEPVTSLVPLVQQKQAVAAVTSNKETMGGNGRRKRHVRVKALEAAEAAKQLEEKRDNERKMKKEAMKLQRTKWESEKERKKVKMEEQKKIDADMASKKRIRDEGERRKKEIKRKPVEDIRRQQRYNEGKLPLPIRRQQTEGKLPPGKGNRHILPGSTCLLAAEGRPQQNFPTRYVLPY